MDFEKFSKTTVKQINQETNKLLKNWRSEMGKINKNLLLLADQFIESCQGGKRLRGVLVVMGYEINSDVILSVAKDLKIKKQESRDSSPDLHRVQNDKNGTSNDIFKVAAAYEIFQTAILAHDDIIDQSPLRRGQPSLYKALGGDHYGISQALSLGDVGFFLATKIISEANFPAEAKTEALKWFSDTMLDTALGEMLDMEKGDVLTIMKLKTARYSVSGPLILGSLLGAKSHLGGVKAHPRGEMSSLVEFGENLGIAFQIQDDILGVFGSLEELGKSVTSDIEEGKNTLLYNYALQKVSKAQKQVLKKYYGQGKVTEKGLEQVRQVFIKTGALDHSKRKAEEYKSKALKILPDITKDLTMSKLLEQMAEYLVERNK